MKILVWLSWGVDSAVSAHLLKQAWHDVIWWFMLNYSDIDNPLCTTRQDKTAAESIAKFLDIPLEIFDFRQEYNDRIIKYIVTSYEQWITPNPDIFCNNLIKFDLFRREWLAMWCDHIATWHYAQIIQSDDTFELLRWVDTTKDQSYFLARLDQIQLSQAIFPLWWLHKSRVREIAREYTFPNAERKDSQWLCFIGNISIRSFLQKFLEEKKWPIIDKDWHIWWKHRWAFWFTIWQKRGLDINKPAYVYKICTQSNTVFVTFDKEDPVLYSTVCKSKNFHLSNPKRKILIGQSYTAKARYRQDPQACTVTDYTNNTLTITYTNPIWWIPSWQELVLYDNNTLVWCWTIVQ